jgi:hypothetical protein
MGAKSWGKIVQSRKYFRHVEFFSILKNCPTTFIRTWRIKRFSLYLFSLSRKINTTNISTFIENTDKFSNKKINFYTGLLLYHKEFNLKYITTLTKKSDQSNELAKWEKKVKGVFNKRHHVLEVEGVNDFVTMHISLIDIKYDNVAIMIQNCVTSFPDDSS